MTLKSQKARPKFFQDFQSSNQHSAVVKSQFFKKACVLWERFPVRRDVYALCPRASIHILTIGYEVKCLLRGLQGHSTFQGLHQQLPVSVICDLAVLRSQWSIKKCWRWVKVEILRLWAYIYIYMNHPMCLFFSPNLCVHTEGFLRQD